MIRSLIVSSVMMLTAAGSGLAEDRSADSYIARSFNPAHPDLPRSAGVPAQLANEDYVRALGRVVCYWANGDGSLTITMRRRSPSIRPPKPTGCRRPRGSSR